MSIRAVKVSNVSLGATEPDIKEFFSFSGEIDYVELHSDNERSQIAYVTFRDPQGAETAVLLSGATIVDQSVTIELDPGYKLPAAASVPTTATKNTSASGAESAMQKAEDIKISAGTILVNDKVREVDEKFRVSETTKSAFAAAEETVSNAGSAIMKNRYVLTGASWVTGAFNRVAKAAGTWVRRQKRRFWLRSTRVE
ncbi:hypothetical protein GH714_020437 [Hevea brasiliensis]|uniref:RRM domain-containing protein n=1 Tax=Hevea brasiliensis TaxID=3981 RepID=A0A6A6M234_HEVBR|nr:hypothetical protein GH714_020437 [Hevea brasiliensis]